MQFEPDVTLTVWLHRIKDDAGRDAFQVNIPPAPNAMADLIQGLKTYIQRTEFERPVSKSVFIALRAPYKGITSATVVKDLDTDI